MSYLLDTNACIALIKGKPESVGVHLRRARSLGEWVFISSITAHELWYGVAKSAHREKNTERLHVFFSGPLEPLSFDGEDASVAGQVRAVLESKGQPIGPFDVLLAGQALRHDLTLITANVPEFARIPQLNWQDWERPPRRK